MRTQSGFILILSKNISEEDNEEVESVYQPMQCIAFVVVRKYDKNFPFVMLQHLWVPSPFHILEWLLGAKPGLLETEITFYRFLLYATIARKHLELNSKTNSSIINLLLLNSEVLRCFQGSLNVCSLIAVC